ncbi:MAG: DUF4424 domain-containing protein [Devosia sp.]
MFANDTTAMLGSGGLVFLNSDKVSMDSEDLFVSPDEVRVTYRFTNHSDADEHALVAFPLPDITGNGDFNVAIPTESADNIFGFSTKVDGEDVATTHHEYVFATNIEYTDTLKALGIPLNPFGEATVTALNALSDAQHRELFAKGLVIPMEYSQDGTTWQPDWTPIWTLRSTFSWEATFPAGKTITVEHKYQPSVGGTVAVTFLAPPFEDEDRAADYKKRYCTDDALIKTIKKTMAAPDDYYSAPYTERWLSYIWSTGGNWSGPIGKFKLTIDKGAADNLVSFCWDGAVKKTGATTFEMEATDWFPPWDRELDILILDKRDPE